MSDDVEVEETLQLKGSWSRQYRLDFGEPPPVGSSGGWDAEDYGFLVGQMYAGGFEDGEFKADVVFFGPTAMAARKAAEHHAGVLALDAAKKRALGQFTGNVVVMAVMVASQSNRKNFRHVGAWDRAGVDSETGQDKDAE